MLKHIFSLVAAVVAISVMAISAHAQPAGTPVLWLDAADSSTIFDAGGVNPGGGGFDATNVARWDDKSGTGYSLESNSPTDTHPEYVTGLQNGQPALRFDATDALMDPSAGLPAGLPVGNEARHIFFAGIPRENDHPPGNPGVNTYFQYGTGGEDGKWNNMFIFDGNNDNSYGNYFAGNNRDFMSNPDNGVHDVTAVPGAATIIEFTKDDTVGSPAAAFYKDGDLDFFGTFPSSLETDLTNVRVGREGGNGSDWDQFELIVYPGILNEQDRQQVGGYLANKWSIPSSYAPISTPSSLTWNASGGGNWNNDQHWDPPFGGADARGGPGANQDVIFGNKTTAAATVFNDTPVTVRSIEFDNSNMYVIGGAGGIQLDRGSMANAAITVVQGSHQFQAVLNLNHDTTLDILEAATLTMNNALNFNGNTLTKTGPGTLTINNIVSSGGGQLDCLEGTCEGNGTVGGNLFNEGVLSPGNSSSSNIAVPEPASTLLLCLGIVGLLGSGRYRRIVLV